MSTITEGCFCTWVLITKKCASFSVPCPFTCGFQAYIVEAKKQVVTGFDCCHGKVVTVCFCGTNFKVVACNLPVIPQSYGPSCKSIFGKYAIIPQAPGNQGGTGAGDFLVLKDGVVKQTITAKCCFSCDQFFSNGGISKSGKYIVIIGLAPCTKNLRLVVYQGQ